MERIDRVEPLTRRKRSWAFDAVVVLIAAASEAPAAHDVEPSATLLIVVLSIVPVLPLLLRRRYPMAAFAVELVAGIVIAWSTSQTASALAQSIGLYSVAVYAPRRQLWYAGAGWVVSTGLVLLPGGAVRHNAWGQLANHAVFFAAAVGFGLFRATRRTLIAQLRERAAQLERERDQQAELGAAAERQRIAREMHDIVAHHLTVMVTMSEAAAAVAGRSTEDAVTAMRTVADVGRTALADTRRLLGVLRDDTVGQTPLPGLTALDDLVASVRGAGRPVVLEQWGAAGPLDAVRQLAVYRLVQEALTNVLKHAGASARATVRLDWQPDRLLVTVTDDGAGAAAAPPAPGHGRGLAGMRERAAAVGASVDTGPCPGGGWRMHAELPLDDDATADGPRATTAARP